jgi:hypothetical protein
MGVFDTFTNNMFRLPALCFAVLLIVIGSTKQRLSPKVGQRVMIAGVVLLGTSLLSWVSWEFMVRSGRLFDNRMLWSIFNGVLGLLDLAGVALLLSAVFLERAPAFAPYPGPQQFPGQQFPGQQFPGQPLPSQLQFTGQPQYTAQPQFTGPAPFTGQPQSTDPRSAATQSPPQPPQ